jgi:hypothetical protein
MRRNSVQKQTQLVFYIRISINRPKCHNCSLKTEDMWYCLSSWRQMSRTTLCTTFCWAKNRQNTWLWTKQNTEETKQRFNLELPYLFKGKANFSSMIYFSDIYNGTKYWTLPQPIPWNITSTNIFILYRSYIYYHPREFFQLLEFIYLVHASSCWNLPYMYIRVTSIY